MKKTYKNEYDQLSLTREQKNVLINKMRENKRVLYEIEKTGYYQSKLLLKAVAVSLAVVIIFGGTYIGSKFSKPIQKTQENSFMITANATSTEKMAEDTVAMFSGVSQYGFLIDDDYFLDFEMSGLTVVGSNIKKFTMTVNQKFCYFALGDIENLSEYKTLTNSQYNIKKLNEVGVSKGCDGFTYTNPSPTEAEQVINLSGKADFIIESDRTDYEIDQCLKKMREINDEMWKIRVEQRKIQGDSGITTEEEHILENKYDYYLRKFMEKTLRDATISVTVTFTDGTVQKQDFDVDFILQDFDGNVIFDPRVDEFNEHTLLNTEGYEWIVFRYAE